MSLFHRPAASRRFIASAVASIVLGGALSAVVTSPAQGADNVTLNLIGINDFHGRIDAKTVKFAGTVEQLRQDGGSDNSLLISAGDNVSASPFASAIQNDTPTIDVLNALELDASATGNHEFDKGTDDLLGRLTNEAEFPWLAANIFDAQGDPILPKSATFAVDGLDVAVVGAITEETPTLVSPAGIAGLTFTDPTDAINETVAELEALADPPDVIVASLHEGAPDGTQTYAENVEHSTTFKKIVEQTDSDVDAIFMAHTHQAYAYDAPIPGKTGKTRPILQTGSYGANVGQIKLTVDAVTGDVQSYTKQNVARTITADGDLTAAFPRVALVKDIVDNALAFAATIGNQPKGTQTADITRAFVGNSEDRASESTIGNLVADALLSKVGDTPSGADIGVVNPGGLRADLTYAGTDGTNTDGVITYAEANSVLPFVNQVNRVTVTGVTFEKILEQQWQRDAGGKIPSRPYLQLGLSKNVNYTFDDTRSEGERITHVTVNGQTLDPAGSYKIATFSFLATGGDNFRAFTEGTSVDTGLVDYEAWIGYLETNSPVSPDFARRSLAATGLADSYQAGDAVSFTLPKLNLTSLNSPANTSVAATLKYGSGQTADLGDFTVTGGSATINFDLPAGVVGAATLEINASPSNTRASIPITISKAPTVTTVKLSPHKVVVNRTKVKVTLTIKAAGFTVADGRVQVMDGSEAIGVGTVRHGKATVRLTPFTSVGSKTLTARYLGNDLAAPSLSEFRLNVVRK
ncbi:MAG: 5'-nucleotidase C-terminal domain-containing protein [Kineosporiaceae bacterium]|nr:5'-nucleotidase C-terminal domain-containing protein [Aeromicrobium sp.]